MISTLIPFFIGASLGLVIGVERERSHPPGVKAAGVRTFILMGILGALAGYINDAYLSVIVTVFAASIVVAGYFRSTRRQMKHIADVGLTTEVAAFTTFTLGMIANTEPLLAGILGSFVLLVLVSRVSLHEFSRKSLKPKEIQAAAILFVLAIGVLPLLPNAPVDPWNMFNPQRYGLIVVIIAAIQFLGYIAIRIFGMTIGVPLTGFVSGFVSSTAAFLSLSQLEKNHPNLLYAAISSAIFATLASLIEVIGIVAIAAPDLIRYVLLPIGLTISVGLIAALLIARHHHHLRADISPNNPLSLVLAMRLAIVFVVILFVIGLARDYISPHSTEILAFLTGLFEIHGLTYAAATMLEDGKLAVSHATNTIIIGVLASLVSKLAIVWIFGTRKFAVITSSVIITMLVSCGITWLTKAA